ncbi:hypothetical protein C8R27_14115 [Nitrosomonas ureae]|uniref:hypothetical protein n=1 Tax=Nitrosomonas ureae TaxID=44577 RepID=UPI000D769E45|nr:hypothetical protein [Nitrosomonas ureae]PXX08945.1 hypothetical protein C8R27_14115 [Nitrosomonas ureae]
MEATNDLTLDVVQKRLDKYGVRDVKFFLTNAVGTTPKSVLEKEVAFLLSTYLDGYSKPLDRLGDAPVNV